MRVLDAFRRVRHVEHPKAFLRKIVVDTVRDHWRRRRVSEDVDAIDERFISFRPQLEAEMDRHRQSEALRSALKLLDPSKRMLVRLFYEEGLSIPEIARLQNSSVPAVKMQLLRIRQKLKGTLRGSAPFLHIVLNKSRAAGDIPTSREIQARQINHFPSAPRVINPSPIPAHNTGDQMTDVKTFENSDWDRSDSAKGDGTGRAITAGTLATAATSRRIQ